MNYSRGEKLKLLSFGDAFSLLKKDHWLLQKYACGPDKGAFFEVRKEIKAFKSCITKDFTGVVVNLAIPEGANIHIGFESGIHDQSKVKYKCRADVAKVHSLFDFNGKRILETYGRGDFRYTEGTVVHPDNFSWKQTACSGGIHFFLDIGSVFAWAGRLSPSGTILY